MPLLVTTQAVATILACWLLATLTLLGWGLLLQLPLLRSPTRSFTHALWLGLLAVIAVLQLLHFALRIHNLAAGALLLVAVLSLLLHRKTILQRLRLTPPTRAQLFLIAFSAILLALISIRPPRDSDTLLYHLQSLRWTQAFPVITGLGNLHGRLAFNPASDLLFAALATGPFQSIPLQLPNGFLLLLLALTAARYLGNAAPALHPLRAFWIAFLPALAVWFYTAPGSLANDLAPFALLTAATCFTLEHLLIASPPTLFLTALLTLGAIVMKLSALGYAGGLLIAICFLLAPQHRKSLLLVVAIGIVALLFPWITRNIVLSGCLFYPVAATRLPLSWSVPLPIIRWEAYAIHTWALWDGWPPANASRSVWIHRMIWVLIHDYYVALLPTFLAIVLYFKTPKTPARTRALLLFLPILTGTLFWLATAPTARFLGPVLWLFAAIAATGFVAARPTLRLRPFALLMLLLSLITGLGSGWSLFHESWSRGDQFNNLGNGILPRPDRDGGVPAIPAIPTVTTLTRSGLAVNVPRIASPLWPPPLLVQPYIHAGVGDAPIPASSYVHPGLQLRDPRSLAKGFLIAPQ